MCINRFNKPSFPRRRESSFIKTRLDSRLRGNDKTALSPFTLHSSRQHGVSLIELVMFIVIISVAVTGVLLVMNQVIGHSADTLVRKQALAIAESLLEEVELMPFTYCDPGDASAVTATSAAGCTGGAGGANDQNKGGGALTSPTPASETRYSTTDPFDNVADYGGCQMNTGIANAGCDSTGAGGIKDIIGNNPGGTALNGYTAKVDINRAGTALGLPTDDAALRITVTATGPGNTTVVLDGYRTRYAPNNLP